jgi:hypothetical protein
LLIARGIAASIGNLMSDVYGVGAAADDIARARSCSAWRSIGIVTSIVAAVIPRAQGGAGRSGAGAAEGQVSGALGGRSRVRPSWRRARLCVDRCLLRRLAGSSTPATSWRSVVRLLQPAAVARARAALRPCSSGCGRRGALAADSLIQAPRRTSASVAALMLSLALVVPSPAWRAPATNRSSIGWTRLSTRIFRDAVGGHRRPDDALPPEMAPELEVCQASGASSRFATHASCFAATPIMIVASDIAGIGETGTQTSGRGDADRDVQGDGGQAGVMARTTWRSCTPALAETLEIPAPTGMLQLPIVGILVDYSDQQGTVLIAIEPSSRSTGTTIRSTRFASISPPDATVPEVKQRILERYAGERRCSC